MDLTGPRSLDKPGQAGMGSQTMMGSWKNERNPCFIICTSSPSLKTTQGDGRMMLKYFAMPTAALGKGDGAQLPLPSPCRLSRLLWQPFTHSPLPTF